MNKLGKTGKMSVFFTSDTHFGHGNIMKYSHRPGLTRAELELLKEEEETGNRLLKVSYDSIKRMDDYLLDGINSTVGENDVLYHLGDFCMGSNVANSVRRYRNAIKCKNVHLVLGNHDGCGYRPWLKNRCYCKLKDDTCYDVYADYFVTASDYQFTKVDGQYFSLFHYAQAIWNKSHRNALHLYGHSHANAEKNLDKILPNRKAFDVGVDNAAVVLGSYRPFSFEEVVSIMSKRKGCSIDHHKGNGDE